MALEEQQPPTHQPTAPATTLHAPENRVKKEAQRAATSRTKAKEHPDPYRSYKVASGVVGVAIVGALLMMVVMPSPKPETTFVNDAGLIAHVNLNAVHWKAGAVAGWEKVTIKDVKKWGAVGVSQAGMMNSQQCNVGQIPNMPATFDARERWPSCTQATKIHEQGKNCSSSYAISAASVLGNRFCISDPELYGNLTLSPQYVLSCDTQMTRGCMGGDLDKLFYYFEGHGLIPESCRPYKAADARKIPCNAKLECAEAGAGVKRYRSSSHCIMTEQGQIEGEMLLNGPVVGLVYLYDDFLVYKSGVYKPMATATCLTDKKGEPLLHAVKIIGWGVSSAEDSGTTVGERYWLIENSFGKDWGEGGYGRIKRGDALAAGRLAEQYDPRMKRDIVLLENFVFAAVPYTARMEEINEEDAAT